MRSLYPLRKAFIYGPLDHSYGQRISKARIIIHIKARVHPKNPFKKEAPSSNGKTASQNLHITGNLKQPHIQLCAS